MKTRKLREIIVSEIGVGCMGFSHGYGQAPPRDESIAAIRAAYERGCTFFDTAEVYGREQFYPGHNEELVGEALATMRKDVVIATKLHIHDNELSTGSVEEIVRAHLQASLKRLGTERVELYYLHRVNENIAIEEVATAMGALRRDGLIDGWGLSQVDVDLLARAHSVEPVSAVQNIYSLVERSSEEAVLPFCVAHNIGFVPFSPIASGLLSGKSLSNNKFEGDDVRKFVPQLSRENLAGNQPIVDLITEYALAHNATCAQISLAWMSHKYPNLVPIPGSKNHARIQENLGASDVALTEEEFLDFERRLNALPVFGRRGHVESMRRTFANNWRKEE
ncbi:MAG: aldo/keto reductase [Planctomycetia bacterium]|nr:aldo/keto reductase [Planctomycetia bacterium]